jgi:predicted DNA-binding antitoxin AbrB/MazE fold protein
MRALTRSTDFSPVYLQPLGALLPAPACLPFWLRVIFDPAAAAIYEKGMLRPLTPLPLAEGARVEVTVTDSASIPSAADARSLREIAALPMESEWGPFSGEDHDRILYGGPTSEA